MNHNTNIEADMAGILKLQHELSRILADVVDPTAGLAEALDRAATLPGLDCVWAWFTSPDTGEFQLGNCGGIRDALTVELDVFSADSPVGRCLMEQREVGGTWQEAWPEKADLIRNLGWVQIAVLPIVSQGEVVGALGAGRKSSECIDEQCRWVLRTLANDIGSLVAGIRKETQHRTTSENLRHALDSFADRLFIVDTAGIVLYHNLAVTSGSTAGVFSLVGTDIEEVLPGLGGCAGPVVTSIDWCAAPRRRRRRHTWSTARA